MKAQKKVALMLALMLLAGFSLSAQSLKDMVGTWTGSGTMEGQTESNELTLVLALEDGKLVGNMTDSEGSINDAPVSEAGLEDGVFTFTVNMESMGMTIKFTMKVTGNTMKGEFEVPEMGMKGTWEAAKQ
jgi:hypothetical protein